MLYTRSNEIISRRLVDVINSNIIKLNKFSAVVTIS